MLYNNLSSYLKSRYGGKIKKICIDGGFSCPNRDGRCGVGGCIFCSERGSGEHIDGRLSIAMQVRAQLDGQKKADGFIAYFQNFTNTYAPVAVLKEKYDEALIDERIVALAIGTRPDCINEDVAELIASYKERLDVWVELGLQTASDSTAEVINRGYKTRVYGEAVRLLDKYGIPVVTHIMIGLPGEGDDELRRTVELINSLPVWGVKIHSVYVCRGTELERMYSAGEYEPISMEDYVRRTVYVLKNLKSDTVIHRLTGDCPADMLVAPDWNGRKNEVLSAINHALADVKF